MPELPEMETYRSLLTPLVIGRRIVEVTVERDKTINIAPDTFRSRVTGSTITRIDRRAKQLIFMLDSDCALLLHLMLGGWMHYGTAEDRPDRTIQVQLGFGAHALRFINLRLGYLHLHTPESLAGELARYGPEPVPPSMTSESLAAILKSKRTALKAVLTDQSKIAGIGNCYADEICYTASVRPHRSSNSLTDEELAVLYNSMQHIFRESIEHGGYMEYPLFAGDVRTGGYNDRCLVYDRGGEPCYRCGHLIVQETLNSRKVFYCANCQR